MREAFLRDMKLLYPHGLDWERDKSQHRDLIHVFSMGWCDALMSVDAREAAKQLFWYLQHTADLNWWPDASWRW